MYSSNLPRPQSLRKIVNFERPTTKGGLRYFLDLTWRYRKFIPNYAAIPKPLTQLMDTTGSNRVAWDKSQAAAFNILKQKLSSHFCSEELTKRNQFSFKKNRHVEHQPCCLSCRPQ
ncbi:hypothetical protein HPB48_014746 [Haemaphysalis longicornis]|uniref:Uncharacterized protein n=1 Tax=Haemaphysalis longicornis TaxID=44386 RepID=A0A9J6FYN3_HAELO|nr:hypothetical protein HPB48_014746 [Haemaphysalis longicornis]